ncbi:endonuclease domain-containing 1 protein-like [Neolamprologus brichardi]|uniref:endonuclease domain-containing 1 protein-like n=1 Tax=Neolamprologus brichardi TaxID=32507 RepID=UPI001643A88E|nr:endonuclease domain-containing 1 protein-like [Neolamprologus brichardi]
MVALSPALHLHSTCTGQVDPCLVTWISNYLTDRPQYVRLKDITSDTVVRSTGDPQGTVVSLGMEVIWSANNCIGIPSRNATFTLTNVVPQNPKLNQNAWRIHESQLTELFLEKCSKAYVLVGAIPSADSWIVKNNVKRVNIPDYLWNAYCCVDNNDRPIQSGAARARNTEDNLVEQLSLDKLETFLQQFTAQPVGELFYNNCRA